MELRRLGRTGLMVSGLGLGALEVGRPWGIRGEGDEGQPPPMQEAEEFLNYVLDSGVNFIDTAAAYWASEERIGSAISHRRDEYILATKWGEWCDQSGSIYDYSADEMWKFLESSLTKLRTDHIDLYQIHARWTFWSGEMRCRIGKRRAGQDRFIGCSCGPGSLAAIASGGFDAVQITTACSTFGWRTGGNSRGGDGRHRVLKDGGEVSTQKISRWETRNADLKAKVGMSANFGAWRIAFLRWPSVRTQQSAVTTSLRAPALASIGRRT